MIRSTARIDVMGCPVDALTLEETLTRIEELIDTGGPHQHVCVNAGKIELMAANPEVRRIVRGCSLISADGVGVLVAARVLGQPLPERVTGVDLMERLVELSARKGYRPFFLGARAAVVDEAVRRFRARFPGLDVAGCRDGYFAESEEPLVVAEVRTSGADLLFVALGSPRQELFQDRWLQELGVAFTMGVGGSIDVFAGTARRSPALIGDLGLEWAYRLALEPRKRWRRAVLQSGRFLSRVLRARLSGYRLPS